jgi:uncharacterized repeat protein (TIGR01451 family)
MKKRFYLVCILALLTFFLTGTLAEEKQERNGHLKPIWEGQVGRWESNRAIDIQSDAFLPPLILRLKDTTTSKIEVSPGKGKPYYTLYLKNGVGRFPFAIDRLKDLSNMRFRAEKSSLQISIEPESPFVVNFSKFGMATFVEVTNWSNESTIYLSVIDLEGNPQSIKMIDEEDFSIADKRYVGKLQTGETFSFALSEDFVGSFPLTVKIENESGETTESVIYKVEAGSFLCATPGRDGAGGTLTGVVNTYYPLTTSVSAGATALSVGSSSGASTQITSGDLLLVIQMQDAECDYSNTDSYGDGVSGGDASGYTSLNQSGKYEFVKALSSVSSGTVSVMGAGINGGLLNSYNVSPSTITRGRSSAQVIRVPQYTTATLSSTLTCLAWNGSVGGILALDVNGTLTLGGTVSVDGMGFRGGSGRQLTGGSANSTDYRSPSTINCFALKGEGFAGTPALLPNSNPGSGLQGYPNGDSGWGAPGNAGGGGNDSNPTANDENAGGGGGSNSGFGGIGGNTWNDNLPLGGYGGVSLPVLTDRLFLGGGGGAGDRNNAGVSSGAAGGGVVIIRANAITGTGSITANGASAVASANDGGGGGGAGGTILVYTTTSGSLTGLSVSANGGNGANCYMTGTTLADRHGPGGGGSGGTIILSGAPDSASVNGGANGVTTTLNDPYGATPGTAGVVVTTLSGTQIPGVDSGAECSGSSTYIVKTSSEGSNYVSPGQTFSYTITATNTTTSTWTNVAITDPLPDGTSWVSTQLVYPIDLSGSYYDQFSTISYSGSNGTINWNTTWSEIGDDGVVNTGDVRVVADGSTNALRLNRGSRGASRAASLEGYTSAILSFSYRRNGTEADDYVTVSGFDGTNWITLYTLYGGTNESNYLSSGNIAIPAAALNSNFQIRFLTRSGNGNGDYFYFDNIQISVSGRGYASSAGGAPPNLASGYTLYPYESLTAVVTVMVNSNLSPSVTQISNTATVNADGGINQSATAVNPVLPAPTINSPIYVGATSINGTSSQIGSTVTVYNNGTPIGTAIVQSDGTWVLNGVSGLVLGDSISASITISGATSPQCDPVIVTSSIPNPPTISGPLTAGQTTVTGSSDAPDGSTVTVYVDGTPYTGTVSGGVFNVTVPPLTGGSEVYATVTVGGETSNPSPTETVHFAAPVVNSPIYAGATTVSGTSDAANGTVITVFVNGTPVGTTTVSGGIWTLSGIGPLLAGDSITATAGTGAAQSQPSAPVIVKPNAPTINGPLTAGQTTVTGSSDAPDGSTVTVYVDGTPYTGTVSGGVFNVTVPPLTGGSEVYATVTVGGETSNPSPTETVHFAAPVVNSPIYAGATTVSGTSDAANGTVITVFVNGTPVGTTTVSGGIWTLSGIGPLLAGDSITATAGTGAAQSQPSAPVIVIASPIQSIPPIVSSPIYSGGDVTISGSSVEPPGSVVTVYVDGVVVGTTTVNDDGSWSLPDVAVEDGQTVFATVQAIGEDVSNPSNIVIVSLNSLDTTPPPVISGPIYGEATSISGTSVPFATIDVYQNGIYLGTTAADDLGNWTLAGLAPLAEGTIVSATATASPTGTSAWSDPRVVGGIVHILRNDSVTSLTSFNRDAVFKRRFPRGPVLEPLGSNHVYNEGEGALQQGNGSSDDDDFYLRDVHQPVIDPDPTVVMDVMRPLVFYELIDNGANNREIFLSKEGDVITITYTP